MPDLKLAAQDAVIAALKAAVSVPVAVYQHVPENAQPPMVILGDLSSEPRGGKDGGLDFISFEVVSLFRTPRRASLYEVMATVRTALEGQTLPAQSGAILSAPEWESDDDELLEDGQTYLGTQRFSLFAQPA